MNKILITGAAGFIGSHLVETLLENKIPLENIRLLIPEKEFGFTAKTHFEEGLKNTIEWYKGHFSIR